MPEFAGAICLGVGNKGNGAICLGVGIKEIGKCKEERSRLRPNMRVVLLVRVFVGIRSDKSALDDVPVHRHTIIWIRSFLTNSMINAINIMLRRR